MRTFYSLTKRQFLGMIKFNKFLYGNSKEKKVFAYTFFAIIKEPDAKTQSR